MLRIPQDRFGEEGNLSFRGHVVQNYRRRVHLFGWFGFRFDHRFDHRFVPRALGGNGAGLRYGLLHFGLLDRSFDGRG
uniref:Uncharacterized protein n=1 Tax=Anopheles atroparvus TaxID=41427 RepID=A0AAG5D6W9_ANOAO